MSDIAITVEKLGKCYLVGHNAARGERYTSLRDVIARNARSLARRTSDMIRGRPIVEGDDVEEFWALQDVSFAVGRGDCVGIIGRNGAGKSTLLKILSRITEPTRGRITISGRTASLLEVGTGFHPELTGRENIYLNGAILGMSRREIDRKFDEIVAFAEVDQFLDTPVKRYSSGMYVRLAFAVAAHLEPEILVVDEVLAVGDATFQRKCLAKMEGVASQGRTVLFVSHNMAAVRSLCGKGILLSRGRVACSGPIDLVIESYMGNPGAQAGAQASWSGEGSRGADEIRFTRAWLEDATGLRAESFFCDEEFVIVVEYEIRKEVPGLRTGLLVERHDGVTLFGSTDGDLAEIRQRSPGLYESRCRVPADLLNSGRYSVGFSADKPPYGAPLLENVGRLDFSIDDRERHGPTRHTLPGVTRPRLAWSIVAAKREA